MAENYADRMIDTINRKGNPCIVGLDPRINNMPKFVIEENNEDNSENRIRNIIFRYHKCVIDAVHNLVPGVKPQIAFFEQYGIGGLRAFKDTVKYAKKKGLMVIADAKRNDISSTAEAYANAFLGESELFGKRKPVFDADSLTVSPYLGRDSLEPFVNVCKAYGKGIFVLVKTSNPSSVELQNLRLSDGKELYMKVAEMINTYSEGLIGEKYSYSSVGAVVGATFPEEARNIRKLMPKSILLVPGYGTQGASAKDVVEYFNEDGLGAVVNASRSITYSFSSLDISEEDAKKEIIDKTKQMIEEINDVLASKVKK